MAAYKGQWAHTLCDCCAPPGGLGLCCYVFICTPCAAGDVAEATGGSYCMSCCVPLMLGAVAPGPSLAPCCWCQDRLNMMARNGIGEGNDPCEVFCMMVFCARCAIIQELNTLRSMPGGQGMTTTTVIAAPTAQVMMPVPGQYGYAPPQQQVYMGQQPVVVYPQQQQPVMIYAQQQPVVYQTY